MSFRSLNVDQYESDFLREEDLFPPRETPADEVNQQVAAVVDQARSAISGGNAAASLPAFLSDPPYGYDVEEAKSQFLAAFLDVLSNIRLSDIPDLLKSLSVDQHTYLMNYIYKGLAEPAKYNSAVLLNWHQKLVEIAGVGCIVRVLNSRPDL
ncbi:ARP2/3 actin-organizing complex subunit Arc5 [Schizosaccharomyces japonicus yFS275]|uniref:Actin-related protein 2/3 complex subunit 5 n=1 Tax=Schizosaccharomyces japonicus (strain yFS275 / FY16936) TaxID=402676 RepID=B6K5X5_SCHJY|nr:ARP2/3 actin-organizing complex subunit Arc5 [Schizosaccharomyces japonicus yFS275]EEB08929.1 ARP2/3 actin-organizing complex subunit Arc5 [Schizosaccharomyces japonicus yFS275]